MLFSKTFLLAALAVSVAASPLMKRGHSDWDGYKNCCDQRDHYGKHYNCKRPDKWGDDWHDRNDNDYGKWNKDGHKQWKQCKNDWQGQYDTWQQAKNKWYNHDKDKYDKEGQEWGNEQNQWNNEHDQWAWGNHPKQPPKPDWNPDKDGWHHYNEVDIVLKCDVGVIIYKDYGDYPKPAPKWQPDQHGWYHFKEAITIKCTEKVVYKYYDSD